MAKLNDAVRTPSPATLRTVIKDLVTDLDKLQAKFDALLIKLDEDDGVTDTDFEATLTVGALLTDE